MLLISLKGLRSANKSFVNAFIYEKAKTKGPVAVLATNKYLMAAEMSLL